MTALDAAYDPRAWTEFAAAVVTAAAALAGLLVVAASINIGRILQLPAVVSRLAATLSLFSAVLIVGILLLVPDQTHWLLGAEIAIVGAATITIVTVQRGLRQLEQPYRVNTLAMTVLGGLSAILIVVAGVGYAVDAIGGLYWLLPATVLGFVVGLGNSWVALVEILR